MKNIIAIAFIAMAAATVGATGAHAEANTGTVYRVGDRTVAGYMGSRSYVGKVISHRETLSTTTASLPVIGNVEIAALASRLRAEDRSLFFAIVALAGIRF